MSFTAISPSIGYGQILTIHNMSFGVLKVSWQPRVEGFFPEVAITTPRNVKKPEGINSQ
jgi:hypothetical protein